MYRFVCSLQLFLLVVGLNISCKGGDALTRFGIDYKKVTLTEIKNYDMVILEQDQYMEHELMALSQSETRVLGYLSLSEVHPSRHYFKKLQQEDLLGKNESWGSYYLNLEDPRVRAIILESVIPEIMDYKLDGLLLDTIDGVAPYSPRHHMKDEMVTLIREIRERYPEATLIQNGGFFLLNQTRNYVDGVMLESVATSYNFEDQAYALRTDQDYRERVEYINKYAGLVNGNAYLVDYVNSREMAARVSERLDTLSYPYYLSQIQLDSLQMFTKPRALSAIP
ncbi:endo alpha-1,4 polygalactosaminidase [Aliifodinibius sp. S!AR15-10]|uniref:endo alpha-1,4 polygalactosaminidase n=1 Tax=Aliifodinibius sp. S!AR15-10 TaxID=2950437 RepID=UPI0028616105|nr:endo alpha-1,4 polygalactosaminidase [Aliifodinibius sp. S!AR15-10]MDR8389777.1 endo alpha-1,4 polygalactosaminidase [Aliifodinibius sp. S!AR15-10]